jgi:hypothetical protein
MAKPEQNKAPPFISVPSLENRLDIGRPTKSRAPWQESAPQALICAPA